MDFNSLMAKMRELDQPATQVQTAPVEECGSPMMGNMPPPVTPPHNPPTLSVNLNAQGMDDIESIMKLMTRVNPDMINQPAPAPMPAMDPIAMLTPPGPSISGIGDLGNLDKGPLKMLPDLDKDDGPKMDKGPEMDGGDDLGGMDLDDEGPGDDISKAQGDLDNDGDHDMDDHDMEKDMDKGDSDDEGDDEEKTDEWANEPNEQTKDVDFMVNKLSGGMNRPKGTHPKVAGGDNPMQRTEGVDLKTSIKNELRSRLEEAKARGAK